MTNEPFSSATALGIIEKLLNQSRRMLRAIAVMLVVVFVIAIGLQIQVSTRNRTLDQFSAQLDRFETQLNTSDATTREARDAAVASKKALEDALAHAQDGSVNQQAVIEALAAIGRIEAFLCGGPCPDH